MMNGVYQLFLRNILLVLEACFHHERKRLRYHCKYEHLCSDLSMLVTNMVNNISIGTVKGKHARMSIHLGVHCRLLADAIIDDFTYGHCPHFTEKWPELFTRAQRSLFSLNDSLRS